MKSLIILIVGILGSLAYAGGEKGNGGKGIVCRDKAGRITSARLLDFYEADRRGIKIDLGGPDLSVNQKIALALTRLEPHDHFRALRYEKRAADFLTQRTPYFCQTPF